MVDGSGLRLRAPPRPEAIAPRLVFRAYAWAMGVVGLGLCLWPGWLALRIGMPPWGDLVLARVLGAIMMGAACCAAAFARVDPAHQPLALGWFTTAHALVAGIAIMQRAVVLEAAWLDATNLMLLTLTAVLGYLWLTVDGERGVMPGEWSEPLSVTAPVRPPMEVLQSRYERQIRDAASQEERHRLARELHDAIKQQIFVIQTSAATAEARFDTDPVGVRAALDQIRSSARDAMTEMEAMLDQLRATPLEVAGLVAALRRQCEALGHRTGAEVAFAIGDLPANESLAPGASRAVFRVAQEALTNIARHARAARVSVAIGSAGGCLRLTISDDGAGFTPAEAHRGMGTANMMARAADYGGRLDLVSRPGQGTTIVMAIPLLDAGAAAYRGRTRWRIVVWSLLLTGALFSLALGEQDLDVVVAAVAAIGVARNVAAYVKVRPRRLSS